MTATFSCARELFEAARDASRDAETIRVQLAKMEADAEGLGGGGFEPRVRSSSDPDRMGGRVAAMVDREAMLRDRLRWDYSVTDAACAVLYGEDNRSGLQRLVPSWWCDVLWWRYLDGAQWDEVADAVHYSARRCQDVAAAALDVADANGFMWTVRGVGSAT